MTDPHQPRIWVRLRPDHVAALDLIERHLNDQVKGIAVVSRAESAGWAILKAAAVLREDAARQRIGDKSSGKINEAGGAKPRRKRSAKRKHGPGPKGGEPDAGDNAGHADNGRADFPGHP